MAGRLKGKIAIVTGAATGIGSAVARLFVDEGANVYAVDIKEPGEKLAAKLDQHSDSIRFDTLDVRSEKSWADGLAGCLRAFGQPNVLINNAGIGSSGKPVHEESVEAMRANFETNVMGMFLGMKTVIPGMMAMGAGSIVNVSSVWGWSAIKNNVAYQTAKAAAVMLSKNAAVTYAPMGIRINCILPGYVDTPMSRTVTPEEAKMLMEFTPLGRRAEPEELAPMFVFLASDESSFVAAANFMNDGGMAAL